MQLLEVQKYLMVQGSKGKSPEEALAALHEEFGIEFRPYIKEGVVTLNYSQIFSPKFSPVADQCRALVLRYGTWDVLGRSFDRFYNLGEGTGQEGFPFGTCVQYEKVDGSIITNWSMDGARYASTRGMAFAEGRTELGRSFAEIYQEAAQNFGLGLFLANPKWDGFSFAMELTSLENRVVVIHKKPMLTLLTVRTPDGYELKKHELDEIAAKIGMPRPKTYGFATKEEIEAHVHSQPWSDEGMVLVDERDAGSHSRIKVKNKNYLAVAALSSNGKVTAKNVLHLILKNEQSETLAYFPEYTKYFNLVESKLKDAVGKIETIAHDCLPIQSQKDFALSIQSKTDQQWQNGVLFAMRKSGKPSREIIQDMGAEKLAKAMSLKELFVKEFGFSNDDSENAV